jgi:hypothetical protein
LNTRSVDAGYFVSAPPTRLGRATSSPPQFGQRPFRTPSAHDRQNVHSNEHIRASVESGRRSRLQHSQLGRSCSMNGARYFKRADERTEFARRP